MNRIARGAIAASTVAVLAPLALAVPAQASTTSNGCTVTPGVPYYPNVDTTGNVPYVDRKITVTCAVGLVAETDSELMEQDTQAREGDPVDDFIGEYASTFDFTAGAGTKTVILRRALPTTPNEGLAEEMYQRLRFRVTSGVVTSPWTAFELTAPKSINH